MVGLCASTSGQCAPGWHSGWLPGPAAGREQVAAAAGLPGQAAPAAVWCTHRHTPTRTPTHPSTTRSGAGLHVGHPEGYTATDITARYKRMRGFNVLHPMGWDAFGLPAEQYAIQTGTHPAVTTQKNIDRFREQLKMLGFSYDWQREVATTDPGYYK